MHRMALLALLVLTLATDAAATVAGGGSKRTDCFAELSGVTLNFPAAPHRAKLLRCRDGDACDADGIANGVCTFDVSVCLDQTDPALPDCTPPADGISTYQVRNRPPADPELAALDSAAAALLPATTAACSAPVVLTVPVVGPDRKGGFRTGKKVVRTTAGTPSGVQDSDRLRIQCVPNPA